MGDLTTMAVSSRRRTPASPRDTSTAHAEEEASSAVTTLLIAAYVVASSAVFAVVTAAVPEPYMDEIFHVPQAVKYCQGRFREVRETDYRVVHLVEDSLLLTLL